MLTSPSAMLILPGDLFGLLDILELAETGAHPSIRRDALFATSPDGIIIELNPKSNRQRKSRSTSHSSRVSDDGRKRSRRCSVASTTSSSCADSDSDSVVCCSSISSCSSTSTRTRTRTKTTISKPVAANTSSSPSKSMVTNKCGEREFTYQSPNTSLLTTVNTSHPENVPKEVASEAINALIDRLDDIMNQKRNVVLQSLKI